MLIGIVGKANVGKSTFFKALTLADVLIANYPFATIEPNRGAGTVRVQCVDRELKVQCNPRSGACINGVRFVPVEMIDVAGLVPGAHEGKGLGLSFLDDLSVADALIHVVDMAGATNERGEPQEPGSYDPANDIKFLEHEFDMWYLSILKRSWEKFSRKVQMEKGNVREALTNQFTGVGATESLIGAVMLKIGLTEKLVTTWSKEELFNVARELRLRTKPMVIAANKMDLPSAKVNIERIRKEFPHLTIVPCAGDAELALKEADKHKLIRYIPGDADFEVVGKLSDGQRSALEFIRQNVLVPLKGTGVQTVLEAAVFDVLKFVAIFPGGMQKLGDKDGNILPDCFLMSPGTTALGFAYKIHTDLGKHFIRANDVRARKAVGKDHPLKHRDVIEIVSGK